MGMGTCKDLTPEKMEQAILHYEELLTPILSFYNQFHVLIYKFLCILGVLSNICIVVVLMRPPMRRNPFNVFLVAIAICDMTLMASYFVFKQVEDCNPIYFTYGWVVFTLVYALLSVFVHSASLWLTVNMAVLRYFVLRDSSNTGSSRWNNYRSAITSVLLALLFSLVGAAPNMLRYEIEDKGMAQVPSHCLRNGSAYAKFYRDDELINSYTIGQPVFWNCSWERFSFWVAGIVLKLIPCLLLTVFMTLLVRMLVEARDRRSRLTANNSGSASGSNCGKTSTQAERTTAMLTMIVALFLITELPQGILVFAIGIKPEMRFAMYYLGNILDLLSLLNSSVNFILYSTMSNLFRREFLETFGFCCPQSLRQWNSRRRLASAKASIKSKNNGAMPEPVNGARKAQLREIRSSEQMQRLIDGESEVVC
ncbi:unnamed protein product [Bursaphelenchus okinawaensis]|uniref:G-protein coupled receptors family 1 profile domain-containing protein n=1 Tax=Bursaphelenchus okinawaensis TaxID=465554 RepID=A0A811JU01_9BILA|nr:unnamed protein product [Bursaphelenchus okinawaensis]CAG9083108.1 unnamed protein product [Bursaphelenchus okinawaensis]